MMDKWNHDPHPTEEGALQNGECPGIDRTEQDLHTQPEATLHEADCPTKPTDTPPPNKQNDKGEPTTLGHRDELIADNQPAATNPTTQEDQQAAPNPAPAPAAMPTALPQVEMITTLNPHLTQADRKLETIYGDHIRADAGTNLDGGIPMD